MKKNNARDLSGPDFSPVKVRVQRKHAPAKVQRGRRLLVGGILTVLVLAFAVNQQLMSAAGGETQERGLASVAPLSFEPTPALNEKEILADLKHRPVSRLASRGQLPSELDQLVFGRLEGKYRIEWDRMRKIDAIHLRESSPSGVVADHSRLIYEVQPFSSISFESLQKLGSQKGSKTQYALIDGREKRVGSVTLDLDSAGRLLSLKFSRTTELSSLEFSQ